MIPIITRLSKNLNNMASYQLISMLFIYFIFFFDMFTQEGEKGIRTSDLHFIKCDPSRLSYILRIISMLFEIETMLFPKNEAYYFHQLIAT
jgi:hypothetical protein